MCHVNNIFPTLSLIFFFFFFKFLTLLHPHLTDTLLPTFHLPFWLFFSLLVHILPLLLFIKPFLLFFFFPFLLHILIFYKFTIISFIPLSSIQSMPKKKRKKKVITLNIVFPDYLLSFGEFFSFYFLHLCFWLEFFVFFTSLLWVDMFWCFVS